jgi:hypothetical protein
MIAVQSAAEIHEEHIGNLLVRSALPMGDEASYRDPALSPQIEIMRSETEVERGNFRSPLVGALGVLLSAGVIAFVSVRSWPAVGVVGAALIGLGWLVLLGSRRTVERTRVWVEDGQLRVVGSEGPLAFGAEDVEGFGVGEEKPLATLFVRSKREGRVLLLVGLTADEAETAASRLAEALGRRAK